MNDFRHFKYEPVKTPPQIAVEDPLKNTVFTQLADWTRSDEYHNSFLIKPDRDLQNALQRSEGAGLPDIGRVVSPFSHLHRYLSLFIAVSDAQGKFLHLYIKSIKAKRALEVGTLGGYSTIWMAKALPEDGEIVTFELSPEYAAIARENIARAGLSSKVTVVEGPATDTLSRVPSSPQFDLAFIDADKANNVVYFKQAERLVRPGGVILVDNVVRHGLVADTSIVGDEPLLGVRALLEYLKDNDSVDATTLATVGPKGYDGLLIAFKKD